MTDPMNISIMNFMFIAAMMMVLTVSGIPLSGSREFFAHHACNVEGLEEKLIASIPMSGFINALVVPSKMKRTGNAALLTAAEAVPISVHIKSRSTQWQHMCSTVRLSGLPTREEQGANKLSGSIFYAQVLQQSESQEEFVAADWAETECEEDGVEAGGSSGETIDKKQKYRLVNGRYVYSNGRDALSYVSSGSAGTWIINTNVEPGIDSGFVYARDSEASLSPDSATSFQHSMVWHWLIAGNWQPQPQLRVDCVAEDESKGGMIKKTSAVTSTSFVYHVELFHPLTRQPTSTQMIVRCDTVHSVQLLLDSTWLTLREVQLVHTYGSAVTSDSISIDGQPIWLLHEVEMDVRTLQWRLMLRSTEAGNAGVRVQLFGIPAKALEVDVVSLATIVSVGQLAKVEVGEYAWAWLAGQHDKNVGRSSVQRVLVQCIANGPRAVFRTWPTDRVAAMQQDHFDEDMGLAFLQGGGGGDEEGKDEVNMARLVSGSHRALFVVMQWAPLGSRILHHIESLLGLNDDDENSVTTKRINDNLSPCFFYHGNPLVPEPLVYVAEIMCVLHGKKAMVMVQYRTPSEAQHRHPLVRPLVRALLMASHMEGVGGVDMKHTVLTYRSDSTLVLFRQEHCRLITALRPEGHAQALHPVPYPDSSGPVDALYADEHAQIYNSWWNGYVLGYPEPQIESYCLDFHNSLSQSDKAAEAARAKRDVLAFFSENGLRRITGTDLHSGEAVGREAIDRIYERVYQETRVGWFGF